MLVADKLLVFEGTMGSYKFNIGNLGYHLSNQPNLPNAIHLNQQTRQTTETNRFTNLSRRCNIRGVHNHKQPKVNFFYCT